jgi:hypothetical protein
MLLVVDVPVRPAGNVQLYDVAPVIAVQVYVVVVSPQIWLGPVIDEGVAGALLTGSVFAGELPQALFALTVMLPDTNTELSIFTVMVFVVDDPVMPAGRVHVYELTLLPVLAVYVADVSPQVTEGPLMDVGVNGTLLTASVLADDTPQVLDAVTEMLPLVKTLLFIAVDIVVVVDDPVYPAGSDQLYCVAPVDAEQV